MTATCITCGEAMKNRFTKDGIAVVSYSLISIDTHYLFCTLRCAARYGVSTANARSMGINKSRQQLVLEDCDRRSKPQGEVKCQNV